MKSYYGLVKKQMTHSLPCSDLSKSIRFASSILQERFLSGEECVWQKTEWNIEKAVIKFNK